MADKETKLVEAVVTANRILANEGILDVFGHISVRSALYISEDEAHRGSKVFESPGVQERAWTYWLARLPQGWRKNAGLIERSSASKPRPEVSGQRVPRRAVAERSSANGSRTRKAKRSGAARRKAQRSGAPRK